MSKTETEDTQYSESILLSSLLKNTVRKGSIYLINQIGVAISGVVILPIYARIFVPAEFGLLSLANLLVSLGGTVIGQWLASCAVRFFPAYQRSQKTDIFYSTILFSIILSVGVSLLLGLLAYFLIRGYLAAEFQPLMPLLVALIPLTVGFNISLAILIVRQEAKRYVVSQLGFNYVALMIGVPLAAYLGLGVAGILWGQIIILCILLVIVFRRLFFTVSRVRPASVSLPAVKEFALYGFPAAASTIGTWMLVGADRYIIEYFRGTAEVGIYSMGYAIGGVITMLVGAFMMAAGPTLMLTYESDNREITARLLSQQTRIFLLVGLPATAGISVLASSIIRLLTTEAYYSAFIVIPFVAVGCFTYGLCLLSSTGLQTAKKTPIRARNWFMAVALNIVLNIIFVPKFGFIAAAATTVISYAALLLLNIITVSKYLKWTVMPRSALNTILASIVMGGAVFGVIHVSASNLVDCILGVIAGIAVYLGMLLLLKEFSRGEIQQVMSLVKDKLPWARHS